MNGGELTKETDHRSKITESNYQHFMTQISFLKLTCLIQKILFFPIMQNVA